MAVTEQVIPEKILQDVISDAYQFWQKNRLVQKFAEPKLDGRRVLLYVKNGIARGWSRAGNPTVFTGRLRDELQKLPDGAYDTELLNWNVDQELKIFDVIRDSIYSERVEWLLKNIKAFDKISLLERQKIETFQEIRDVANLLIKAGFEGVVVKADREYGISNSWLKVKKIERADFILCGIKHTKSWIENREARAFLIGIWRPDLNKIEYIGDATHPNPKTSSFFSLFIEQERVRVNGNLYDMLVPKFTAEIEFQERFDEGALRHGVIVNLRDDKPVTSCLGETTWRGIKL